MTEAIHCPKCHSPNTERCSMHAASECYNCGHEWTDEEEKGYGSQEEERLSAWAKNNLS